MSENANNKEQSHEHDAALSALYLAAEQHEPPDHIEDEILAAVRKEVRAGLRRRTRVPTSSPWFIPMATAAVLVLSAGIVILMRQQSPELLDATRIATLTTPSQQRTAVKPVAPQSGIVEPNDALAAGAITDSAAMASAKMKASDEPRVARFIGSKRDAAGVSSFASAPSRGYASSDDWLREIARLQHVGENQLAETELNRFREINSKIPVAEIDMKLEKYRHELSGAALR